MTTYNELAGLRVNYLGSDPTLNTGNEGQVWYNSTSGTLKSLVQLKAWSSSGAMTTARRGGAGAGIQTQGLAFGGASFTVPTTFNNTEEYSGYTWAAGGNMNTARGFLGGSGTQTAGLAFGGTPGSPNQAAVTTATEEYDGSTWASNPTGLNTTRRLLAGFGTQTATIAFGGDDATPGFLTNTESYNGSTWTSSPGSLASGIETGSNAGAGIQTAGITAGTNAAFLLTQTWNGSAWASGPNLNNNQGGNNNLVGTQTSSLVFGGPSSLPSEQWDGSTWTSTPALGTQRRNILASGIATSGLAGGGINPSNTMVTNTEEFNSTIFSPATGAWASGGNLNTARSSGAGAGTQTEALCAGGSAAGIPGYDGTTEEYNGTTWGPGGNLNTGRGYAAGAGTQTSAVVFGGFTPSSPTFTTSATEEYDGSTWANNPTGLGTARYGLSGCGTQTAALAFGGTAPPGNQTEEYDGSTWTTGGNLNTARKYLAGCGTQTAGLAVGGNPSTPTVTGATEEYDGSAWTSNPTGLNSSRGSGLGAAGTITSAVAFGGLLTAPAPGTGTTATELYDGSNWISAPPMTTGRYFIGNAGNASSGLAFGGRNAPARNANTEEWTGTPSTGTASTLTTS